MCQVQEYICLLSFSGYDCITAVRALSAHWMILVELWSSCMAFNRPELALTRDLRIPEYLSAGISNEINCRYWKTRGKRPWGRKVSFNTSWQTFGPVTAYDDKETVKARKGCDKAS